MALVGPVLAASLAASLTAGWLGAVQTTIEVGPVPVLTASDLAPFMLLGLIGGLLAVAIMQLVTGVERAFRWARIPRWARPALGGALVGGLALMTPHVLSSGHGALHVDLQSDAGWQMLLVLFVLKVLASALSLGSGFRGGLFFASLYLGALFGKAYALIIVATGILPALSPLLSSVVGMAALAVGIVGGPMTMAFLALETTGDLGIASAVLAASIVSAVVVRETFGYSFSTWRLHLRGETIRSAHDVGRMRSLTVSRMMRSDLRTVAASLSLDAFRAIFPARLDAARHRRRQQRRLCRHHGGGRRLRRRRPRRPERNRSPPAPPRHHADALDERLGSRHPVRHRQGRRNSPSSTAANPAASSGYSPSNT